MPFGEINLNSIDMDGTGMGLDYDVLGFIPHDFQKNLYNFIWLVVAMLSI